MKPPYFSALLEQVGEKGIISDAAAMASYLTDWRGRYHGRAVAVIRPDSTDQVAQVVRICAENGVAIVPQGGNTGLCGGASPVADVECVVISLDRLKRVRCIDPLNKTMTVDAGCTLAAVRAAADDAGYLFPLSLGSEGSCQIGGNISTNAGGVAVLRYGNTRDLVLGMEAVLPDGRLWDGLRGLRKDNTGYDLKHLFIGAEGTLGIVTGAVLKLFPKPKSSAVAWVAIEQLEKIIELLSLVQSQCAELLTSFEIISRSQLDLVYRHIPDTREPLSAPCPWVALVELNGMGDDAAIQGTLESVIGQALELGLAQDAVMAMSRAQAKEVWHIRHSVSEANVREGISISHDISVPISRIPEFVAAAESALSELAKEGQILVVGHAGDGNLHFIVVFPHACWDTWSEAQQIEKSAAITAVVHEITLACAGSISAEHGIGVSHREALRHAKSVVELDLMRAVKKALDPKNLMNPAKLL